MDNQNTKTDYKGALTISFLSPDCSLFGECNGFLTLNYNNKFYPRVILTRALPLGSPDKYISVSDIEKNEIGIIEDKNLFSAQQQILINNELKKRYYMPKITSIENIKDKMGHFYFDVHISGKKHTFSVRDLAKHIRLVDMGVIITDSDGNRYLIRNLENISKKSRKKLEPYLY